MSEDHFLEDSVRIYCTNSSEVLRDFERYEERTPAKKCVVKDWSLSIRCHQCRQFVFCQCYRWFTLEQLERVTLMVDNRGQLGPV